MWFCTRDGLSRFDGARFVTYRVGDKNSPPGIEGIFETSGGTYWVSTSAGLYRFNATTLSRPQKARDGRPFLNAEFVSSHKGVIQQDSAGQIWFAGSDLYRLLEKNGKLEFERVRLSLSVDPNRSIYIVQMEHGPDGSTWLMTNVGLVRRLPDGRAVQYKYESNLRQGTVAMAVQPNGNIWAGWGKALFVIKPEPIASVSNVQTLQVRPLTATSVAAIQVGQEAEMPQRPGDVVQLTKQSVDGLTLRMTSTSDGAIWITSNNELLHFDGHRIVSYGAEQGLPAGMAEMAEDSAGSLWIGSRTGLVRLDRKGFVTYGPADGLNARAVYAINQSVDGTLYFANGDYYVSSFDGKRFTTTHPTLDPNARALWTSRYAFLSSANEWWILSTTKLYRFAAGNLKTPVQTYTSRDGFKENMMFQIFEDSKGDLWLSQQPDKREDMGLYRLRRGEKEFRAFTTEEGFPNGKSVSSLVEDKQGNIWLGFYEWGIARYKDSRFEVFSTNDGLPPGNVLDLLIDRKGRLWIGSVIAGLSRVDDTNATKPTFTSFTTDQGLSSNNIRTITSDAKGDIYAGTVRGVDQISLDTERVKHYSVNDGLASDFLIDSLCDRNGTLWFATTGGLSRLNPSEHQATSPPPIWLGGLRIAGEDQPVSELGDAEIQKGELGHTKNNFQIDFFGLSFRPGETLRYQYMLEGADSDWSAPSELRTVTYANLKPGSYRFLVRAINSEGLTSERPAMVSFRILSPIWLRWWFITLAILLTVAMAFLFYRYRTARLHEVNAALADAKRAEEELGRAREERINELERVRIRIATDLHDDIGASLTQIAILSEVAQQQNIKGNGGAAAPLKSIALASNELVETMSDIVWAINPQRDHLQDLIHRMRRFASDLFSAKGIVFDFEAPELAPDIPLGPNPRREVFLIFKESLTNIVKHAEATHVQISFGFSRESLMLRISDDGKGFSIQSLSAALFAAEKGGHGVLSMRKRATEMNGQFEITSTPGAGTVVTFELPLENVAIERRTR